MNTNKDFDPKRKNLHFSEIVERRFDFLIALGFLQDEALPSIVRYRKGDIEISIYHGRQSYEVGVEFANAHERYSMAEIIRSADPQAAEGYCNPAATTGASLASAVDQLADLVSQYGERVLRNDSAFLQTFISNVKLGLRLMQWTF